MTSRELVKKTLKFEKPDRIPRHLWTLPWAYDNFLHELADLQKKFPDDICVAPSYLKQTLPTKGEPYAEGIYVDEWGCVFENKHRGIIGEVKEPLISSWNDLDKIRIPEELFSVDIKQVNSFCKSTDLFVLAGGGMRLFERLQFIRRTDNLFMDIAEESTYFYELVNIVHQFNLKQLEIWMKTDVDAAMISDDWGSQRSLLIAPDTWRKIFKPLYKEYFDIAHHNGKFMFMHSDGYIKDILPDLIEIGLDAINSQIFCMDVAELGRKFKGKITFWGEIDRQNILPQGKTDEVIKAVELVKSSMYQNGGVIAQCEFGPGAKPENVYTVFEIWNKN
ncbi:MAG: methyltransferase [Planctomycetes bacterium GWF2_42_9]|nr:MAG: methyltransferase [Planctomycetes bacterium GWF2_42_9]